MNYHSIRQLKATWLLLLVALVSTLIIPACTLIQGQGAVGEESLGDTWVIQWHREGGIAGFCNDVTIYTTGSTLISNCQSGEFTNIAEAQLTADEQETVNQWRATFSSWSYEQSDPAVADAILIRLEFVGDGTREPDEATLQQMSRLAQQVLSRGDS
ncbi:MAG: hypothetical protein R3C44_13115 [Chloroflexota bacterium]